MDMKEREIDFDELMEMVEYYKYAAPEYGQYVLNFPGTGIKYRFQDTAEVVPTISQEGWIVTKDGLPMTGCEFVCYTHEGINVGDIVTVMEEIPSHMGDSTAKIGERFRVKSIRLVGDEFMYHLATLNLFSMPYRASVGQVERFDMDRRSKEQLVENTICILSIATKSEDMVQCSVCCELTPRRKEGEPPQSVNVNGESISLPEARTLCESCLDNLRYSVSDHIDKLAIETREVQHG